MIMRCLISMIPLISFEDLSDIRLQQSVALFLIALSIVTFIAGFIIRKTGFLNPNKKTDGDMSFSRAVGKYMIISSIIVGVVTLFAFLISFVGE